jgi:hypothetical protein
VRRDPNGAQLHEATISGSIDGTELIRYYDPHFPLVDGGIALVREEGLVMTNEVL